MEGFHYKNGLYFKRNTDHSVTITQMASNRSDEKQITFQVIIDECSWASIISSVSASGEGNLRYYKALEWHNGEDHE